MLKQVIEVYELLDDAGVDGRRVSDFLREKGLENIEVHEIRGERGKTDFIKAVIPGLSGKSSGGASPTLGIIGRLGGHRGTPRRG